MSGAVEIARCSSIEEAVVLAACLDAHGIPATVADFNMSINQWMMNMARTNRVLVPACCLEDAQIIIMEQIVSARDLPDDPSEPAEDDGISFRQDRWKVWLIMFGLAAWFAAPMAVFLIFLERTRRKEPVLGFHHSTAPRTDKLFAPFPIRKGKPVAF